MATCENLEDLWSEGLANIFERMEKGDAYEAPEHPDIGLWTTSRVGQESFRGRAVIVVGFRLVWR